MSKKSDDRKNLVILGGGWYGALLARQISATRDAANFNLILIDALPYTLHRPATARIVVTDEGNFAERALIPRDKLLLNGNGTIKVGRATRIQESAPGKGGEIVLESGEIVPYAALVLATGYLWEGPLNYPLTSDAIPEHIAQWRTRFSDAKHIVLVGGGAVGVGECPSGLIVSVHKTSSPFFLAELAGELRDTYPVSFFHIYTIPHRLILKVHI